MEVAKARCAASRSECASKEVPDASETRLRGGSNGPIKRNHTAATTIITGIAMPTTAKTMWNASETPICEQAARRSGMAAKNSYFERTGRVEVSGGQRRLGRLPSPTSTTPPSCLTSASPADPESPIVRELCGQDSAVGATQRTGPKLQRFVPTA